MKNTALIFLYLSCGFSSLAQSSDIKEPKRNPEWDSNTYYVEQAAFFEGGYLTLVKTDPLTVAEDPITGYSDHASIFTKPATPTLAIDFKDEIPKARVTIAISDTNGKLLQSESFIPKEKKQVISIRKLKKQRTYRVALYYDDKRVLYWGTFQRS